MQLTANYSSRLDDHTFELGVCFRPQGENVPDPQDDQIVVSESIKEVGISTNLGARPDPFGIRPRTRRADWDLRLDRPAGPWHWQMSKPGVARAD